MIPALLFTARRLPAGGCDNQAAMPNPFRREQDAFRMLVAFVVGAAIVIAVTLVTGSSIAGLATAALLVCGAAVKLWQDYRRTAQPPS
jgi:hypothetical protein